jgi:hypothetical protein
MQALPPHRGSDRHRALRLRNCACKPLLRVAWVIFEPETLSLTRIGSPRLREGIRRHRCPTQKCRDVRRYGSKAYAKVHAGSRHDFHDLPGVGAHATRLSTAARASSLDGRLRRPADERFPLALEHHLAENWKPLGEDRYPDAPALVVNFPFGWRRIPSPQ